MKTTRFFKYFAIAFLLLAPLTGQNAYALSLDALKQKLVVGEKDDGYIGIVNNASVKGFSKAEVEKFVKSVNDRRKDKYKKIAAKNKTNVKAVASEAGKKLIKKAPRGDFVKKNGRWSQK